jgi:Holliday junction resolvase RusA-like endonuclease
MTPEEMIAKGFFPVNLCEDQQKELEEMDIRVDCTITGDPISKQRPRIAKNKNGHTYTPTKTHEAEAVIQWSIKARHRQLICDSDSAFSVSLNFHCKNYQRRDVDNMMKLVMDACNGLVWGDDSQVISLYGTVERGSSSPRTEIFIVAEKQMAHPMAKCPVCHKKFKTYPSWPFRIYCSSTCFGLSIRNGARERCTTCRKEIYVRPCERSRNGKEQSNHFCSKECYWDFLRRKPEPESQDSKI